MAYLQHTHDNVTTPQAGCAAIAALLLEKMDHLWIGLRLVLPNVRLPFLSGEASLSHMDQNGQE